MARFGGRLVITSAVAALLTSRSVWACTCPWWPPSPREALVEADAVFAGTIVRQRPTSESTIAYTFEVDRIWKGDIRKHLEIDSAGWSCDYPFELGTRYLVYATRGVPDARYASLCSRTKPAWRAVIDVVGLPPSIEPFPPGNGASAVPLESVPAATLSAGLSHPSAGVRLQSLLSMANRPDSIASGRAEIAKILKSGTEDEKRTALYSLEMAGESAAVLLPELILRLEDPSARIRIGAANVVRAMGPHAGRAVPALSRVLEDPRYVSQLAAERERLSESDFFRLQDQIEEAMNAAARALGAIGPEAAPAAPALLEAIRRGWVDARQAGVFVSIGAGVEDAAAFFQSGLEHELPGVRAAAAAGLGAMSARQAIPALLERLGDREFAVRESAARALGRMGEAGSHAVPALSAAIESDPSMHGPVAAALISLGAWEELVRLLLSGRLPPFLAEQLPEEALPLLETSLGDSSAEVRGRAASCLGFLGGKIRYDDTLLTASIADALLGAVDDESPEVRTEAVSALAKTAPESVYAVEALLRSLRDAEAEVRRRAAEAIEKLRPSAEVIASLSRPLNDESPDVRAATASTLGKARGAAEASVPWLIEATRDPDRGVRLASVRALGSIGDRARVAAPRLEELAHGADREVAESAWFALQFIGALGPARSLMRWVWGLFALTVVTSLYLVRRVWFQGKGGRPGRAAAAASTSLAVLLGWEILDASGKVPYDPQALQRFTDFVPLAIEGLRLAIGNPQGVEGVFGYALASGDDWFVVGTLDRGAYVFDGGTGDLKWRVEGPRSGRDLLGSRVARVGKHVVVGASHDGTLARRAGAVFLYGESGKLLVRIDNPRAGVDALFGSVLAGGSDRFLAAAPRDGPGVLYVFRADGTLDRALENPEPMRCREFPSSLAFLEGRIVAGAEHCDGHDIDGMVFVFDRAGGRLLTLNNPDPGEMDLFGGSVAVVGDDILVGARQDSTAGPMMGAVYLFDGETGKILLTLPNPEPAEGHQFGGSVLGLDENRFAVGGTEKVYVYERSGALVARMEWPRLSRAGLYQGHFGSALAKVGDGLLIAAPHDDAGFVRSWFEAGLPRTPRIPPSRIPMGGAVYLFDVPIEAGR